MKQLGLLRTGKAGYLPQDGEVESEKIQTNPPRPAFAASASHQPEAERQAGPTTTSDVPDLS
jgi:hypothetical protein